MSDLVKTRGSTVALAASIVLGGCAVFGDEADLQWRRVTVAYVQPRAALGSGVDVRCAAPTSGTPDDPVAVVRYRVGRAPYLQAFAIPTGRSLSAGDTVVVHPSRCLVKDAAAAS